MNRPTTKIVRTRLKDNLIDTQEDILRRLRALEAKSTPAADKTIDAEGGTATLAVIMVRGEPRLVITRSGDTE